MNWKSCLLIIGDILIVILMGFYAGVGIWESGEIRHILGMLLPGCAVWFLMAFLLKLYHNFPADFGSTASLRDFPKLCSRLISAQKLPKLLIVWGITCLTACLWQAFYWRYIIRSETYMYRFSLWTISWYASSYASFLFFWRVFWTIFTAVICTAKENTAVRTVLCVFGVILVLYASAALIINLHYQSRVFSVENVPEDAPRTALVFGAGVYYNGEPSAVLTDRVLTAVELYQKGIIDEMIMSGDNSERSRYEVDHMTALALESGVPESAILRDDNGVHTAESCYNARTVFGKENVIFVSQGFHNVRILMTAESYGLTGIAVRADRRIYNIFSWMLWYVLDWVRLPIYRIHYR